AIAALDSQLAGLPDELKRLDGQIEDAKKAAGDVTFRKLEGDVSPVQKFVRDYPQGLGVLGGILAGGGIRAVVTRGASKASAGVPKDAEEVMKGLATGDVARRVADVNQVYRMGGAGKNVPFLHTPNEVGGFKPNPNVADIDTLFRPSAGAKA